MIKILSRISIKSIVLEYFRLGNAALEAALLEEWRPHSPPAYQRSGDRTQLPLTKGVETALSSRLPKEWRPHSAPAYQRSGDRTQLPLTKGVETAFTARILEEWRSQSGGDCAPRGAEIALPEE
ncbi:Hypothetical protein NTJ_15371 [Nesidiocoris tenuis]|uniref:Uncharacterized protein n=1 Tax=Nesidiocoris tenuis TaxID=355587 RepID=A0ABN7BDV2_9HEMI|nr:Hypothetical protein NTJ_15371 [Nesidiocoris tenuis]